MSEPCGCESASRCVRYTHYQADNTQVKAVVANAFPDAQYDDEGQFELVADSTIRLCDLGAARERLMN